MKHHEFKSKFLEDFEVVEQKQGDTRFYPHTEQLPRLYRALNLQFRGALPNKIANADHRADGFRKVLLHRAVVMFCYALNVSRPDQLRLLRVFTPENNK